MDFVGTLVLFLFLADNLLAAQSTLQGDCLVAEKLCVADPICDTTYQTLQRCLSADRGLTLLGADNETECRNAQHAMQRSYFQNCRCQRGMKKEEQCLKVYWDIHPTFMTHGFLDLEFDSSPYEEAVGTEPWQGTDYNRVAALLSGPSDAANPCLRAADICSHDEKCSQHRSAYVSSCNRKPSNSHSCDRRRCHKNLRHFFEKVPQEYSLGVLFCSCKDTLCGERRRQTIVPACSFEEEEKPNCLHLLEECNKENICRSRLANFKQNCQISVKSRSDCVQENPMTCLLSCIGMIGTTMTPNYVSNSSLEISLWCSCDRSGNQVEECEKIRNMFTTNSCLRNAMESYMNVKKETAERNVHEALVTPPSFQQDDIGVLLTPEMNQEADKETKQKHLNGEPLGSEEAMKPTVPSGSTLSCPLLPLSLYTTLTLLCLV